MAVNNITYSTNAFPYAAILTQLTNEFSINDAGPIAAYSRFQQLRRAHHLLSSADYCSTTITSSGHARNAQLNKSEALKKNTETAQQLVAELANKGCLHPRSVILPVDLGYIPTWNQSDYILFWLAVIAGFDLGDRPSTAKIEKFRHQTIEYLDRASVDLVTMNNSNADGGTRAKEYFKFAKAIAHVASNYRPEPHSAHRVVNLIDTQASLGCQTERLFAHLHGIPVYDVKISGPASSSRAAFANVDLYKDLNLIFSYGGTALELTRSHSFTLEERAPTTSNWRKAAI
jgi:hypothetical protein